MRSTVVMALTLLLVLAVGCTNPPPGNGSTEPPAAPTNVTATPGPGSITVGWDHDGVAVTGFTVFREVVPDVSRAGSPVAVPLDLAEIAQVGPAARSFVDADVSEGSSYRYAVAAQGAGGVSPPTQQEAPAVAPGPGQTINVLCSTANDWCAALGPAFQEATGVSLTFLRLSSLDALNRLRAEADAPIFDVWFGGTGDAHMAASLEDLTVFETPSAWTDLALELRTPVEERFAPLYAGVLGFVINEDALEDAPRPATWDDLADPALEDLIAMPDPRSSGTGYTILATLVQLLGEDEAFELLADIHQNVKTYTASGGGPGQLAATGSVAVGLQFMHDGFALVDAGFPLDVVAPTDGTGFEIGGLSRIAGGPNPEATNTFVAWALTPAAQALAASVAGSFQYPSNVNAPAPPGVPPLASLPLIEYDLAVYGSPEMIEHLLTRWEDEVYSPAQ